MAKRIVVISKIVNAVIKEYQPDVDFHLFSNLEELAQYIEHSPLRADELFFTRDVVTRINTSLAYLISMLNNPFLKVDRVLYITEKNSPEIKSVEYIIKENNYTNWDVIQGNLTREFVDGVVNGTLRTDDFETKRNVVYRIPRAEYIRERSEKQESLSETFVDDDHYLENIPYEKPPVDLIPDNEEVCKIVHIAGISTDSRTQFAMLAAQYLSYYGKTIIIEKDVEWHSLTEFVTKSGIDCLLLEVSDILKDASEIISDIKHSAKKLIVVGAINRVKYSYSFIVSLLYNNLHKNVKFLISEDNISEVPILQEFVAVTENSIVDILRMCGELETVSTDKMKVVVLNKDNIAETKLESSLQINTILEDLLMSKPVSVTIVSVLSLIVKDNPGCDLRSILL